MTREQILNLDYVDKRNLIRQGSHPLVDILLNDPNSWIRREFAIQGRHLYTLLSDPSHLVRMEVARQGFALSTLVNDPHYAVRLEVAKHGDPHQLNLLLHDPDWRVRWEIAKQGNPEYLLFLTNDECSPVRNLAQRNMREKEKLTK